MINWSAQRWLGQTLCPSICLYVRPRVTIGGLCRWPRVIAYDDYFGNNLFAPKIRRPRRHNLTALFVNMVFSDEDKILIKINISVERIQCDTVEDRILDKGWTTSSIGHAIAIALSRRLSILRYNTPHIHSVSLTSTFSGPLALQLRRSFVPHCLWHAVDQQLCVCHSFGFFQSVWHCTPCNPHGQDGSAYPPWWSIRLD